MYNFKQRILIKVVKPIIQVIYNRVLNNVLSFFNNIITVGSSGCAKSYNDDNYCIDVNQNNRCISIQSSIDPTIIGREL